MSDFFKRKRVIVTGGAGFLGSHLVEELREQGCANIFVPTIEEFDFRTRQDIERMLREHPADIIIHLAASVGGIGANQANPGSFFYDNAIMGIELVEQARRAGIGKLVLLGTICAYPKFCPVPFREVDLWNGYPEETNAPYGLAKKMLLVQAQAYRQQYGLNAVYLLPVNLYGPRDNFNLQSSHVIPAMIRKCLEAKASGQREIELWGTGKPTREFLYVKDAAEAIVLATERYNEPEPVNIGSGMEISIRDLAGLIGRLCGFEGEFRWDSSKPDGQPRRLLSVEAAYRTFGFRARTELETGLRETIEWYKSLSGQV
jgi:GDP-L-fucose synthase